MSWLACICCRTRLSHDMETPVAAVTTLLSSCRILAAASSARAYVNTSLLQVVLEIDPDYFHKLAEKHRASPSRDTDRLARIRLGFEGSFGMYAIQVRRFLMNRALFFR